MDVLQKLSLAGLIPVISIEDASDAVPLCRALRDGGLPVAEITFRSAAAEEAIRAVHENLPDVLLGAGTVLTCAQVDRAVAAGAAYIVSPGINLQVVRHCQEIGIPIVPGCANPSDIDLALSAGLNIVKFFPAEAMGGLQLIKAISAPYSSVKFLPTGGIHEKNLVEYLSFPQVAACGGSWMVPKDAIAQKDWHRIETSARNAVRIMLGLELRHIGINSESPENARKTAEVLGALLDEGIREGTHSVFAGNAFELMKEPSFGTCGHIAIACNDLMRARWYLERRGFNFDERSAKEKAGKVVAIYFRNEIGGFAVHLLQK